MRKSAYSPNDSRGVFAVPPLARRTDPLRTIDLQENDRLVAHMVRGGITRLIYGGNAFLYHITLSEYEPMLEWLAGLSDDLLCIPGAGPSFGRAMDQAAALRRYAFPLVMLLPCADPRDAPGIERGIREFVDAIGNPIMAYMKDEENFGSDKEAGLDVIGRLVDSGAVVAIKYAVVRQDPNHDDYLAGLLRRVHREKVISGIGERPAIVHMRDWGLPGFTTGSGCVAPSLSNRIYGACTRHDYDTAEAIRNEFLPLEDLRDEWGPARVLHAAVDIAGIARTGGIPPFVSPLTDTLKNRLLPAVTTLMKRA